MSTEVLSCGQDNEGIWAQARMPDGGNRRFTAKYLLACDGGSSPIRKSLGITLEDLGFDEPWLVVDAIVPDTKLDELPQTQVQYCDPPRPCTYVIGPGNHRRWEIMLLPGDSLSPDFPDAELWPLLARWLKPGEARLWRAATYRFRSLLANDWRRGRILLAGDAAHMTPPFMSQSMVQGIRDGLNLAWKLERVVRGTSADALLDNYGLERRPHVIAATHVAISLGREICERDPDRARKRDARLLAATRGGLHHTDHSAELDSRVDGCRVDIRYTRRRSGFPATSSPFAEYKGRRLQPATPTTLGLSADEENSILEDWLKILDCRIVIVRPDHYVFGSADSVEDAIQLLATLRHHLQ